MRLLWFVVALLLAALGGAGLKWAIEHYTEAPRAPPVFDDPRLSFHRAAHLARAAVRRYRDLPPYERRALTEALTASIEDLDRWRRRVTARTRLLCLGERHDAVQREFLARHVLPRIEYDVLMLETGAEQLAALRAAHDAGEPAALLDAPLGPLLADAAARRPRPDLVPIDEPVSSPRRGAEAPPSRERRLVDAVARHWRPGRRHVVVFGALHCRDIEGWMYREVARAHPRIEAAGMHGTVLLARYQEPGAQVLFYLLEEIGLGRPVLAIPDVRRFPREVQDWLPPTADALAGYGSAVLFDERALALEPAAQEQ